MQKRQLTANDFRDKLKLSPDALSRWITMVGNTFEKIENWRFEKDRGSDKANQLLELYQEKASETKQFLVENIGVNSDDLIVNFRSVQNPSEAWYFEVAIPSKFNKCGQYLKDISPSRRD